jgi:hypothetical protein
VLRAELAKCGAQVARRGWIGFHRSDTGEAVRQNPREQTDSGKEIPGEFAAMVFSG